MPLGNLQPKHLDFRRSTQITKYINYSIIMSSSITWKCIDCDESHILAVPRANTCHICAICGSTLVRIDVHVPEVEGIQQNPIQSASWEGLFDILGDDFREAVEESMSMSRPSRQISTKYLSTLGKITIDSRHTIMYDVSVLVGPLTVVGVCSTFSYLPEYPTELVLKLRLTGTVLIETNLEPDSIVALTRGETTFEVKARNAVSAGANALMVFQTYDKWPFMMTSDEGSDYLCPIPVVMVSKLHSELISKMVAAQSKNRHSIEVKLKFGEKVTQCSICQDSFCEGEEVYKLPCRHVYHCNCVTSWLEKNHTCPLCRLQLPRELPTTAGVTSSNVSSSINQIYY